MKPLFTVHAGEFLVGNHISSKLKRRFDVWLPVRDTGVDLLLTCKGRRSSGRQPIKLQVKFSRGFAAKVDQPEFEARGWYTLKPEKIAKSDADYWVFVILPIRRDPSFVLVPTKELKRRMPRGRTAVWHLYLTIFNNQTCFDTRGMKSKDVRAAPLDGAKDRKRDYTAFLNAWDALR